MILPAILGTALAASPSAIVSVEHAPFHRVVLATPDYAVIEVAVPPGGVTGFHHHPRELFYITIVPALISIQKPGEARRDPPLGKIGNVGTNDMTAGAFIHNVINRDTHLYHVIGVEIRREWPLGSAITEHDRDTRFVMVQDNPRIRAWRLTLQPGEAAPPLRYVGTGLRVYVRDGTVTTTRAGVSEQPQLVTAGQFEQLVPGETRVLINSGTGPIELIDVEFK